MRDDLEDIEEWSKFFDALCIERGYLDNGELATRYCELARNSTRGAYEGALKNLNNWRHGLHTPSRRNFRFLTLALEISRHDDVSVRWNHLYDMAVRRRVTANVENGSQPSASAATSNPESPVCGAAQGRKSLPLAVCVGAIVLAVGAFWLIKFDVRIKVASATAVAEPGQIALDMTGNLIPWREFTAMTVGESKVIHGARGRCGEAPPLFEATFGRLPELAIGTWSDGGLGYRISSSCGGPTPARAIVFTATEVGMEEFYLFEDPVTIQVEE